MMLHFRPISMLKCDVTAAVPLPVCTVQIDTHLLTLVEVRNNSNSQNFWSYKFLIEKRQPVILEEER